MKEAEPASNLVHKVCLRQWPVSKIIILYQSSTVTNLI